MFNSLTKRPDRAQALASYRDLAPGYEAACTHIQGIRAAAITLLALRDGDTVFDVACGAGAMLPALAQAVGARGRVIGIEQSPEMASEARKRIAQAGVVNVTIIEAPVEQAALEWRADALLFCYTHDIFQSPAALENVFAAARPGARIAVAGAKLVTWWLAPVNLWMCYRARHYLTTYRGLSMPWRPLLAYCPDLHFQGTWHLGTSYLAAGTVQSASDAP